MVAGLALAAFADPPVASFTMDPPEPRSGQLVTFTSTATGTVEAQSWDLDGDGRCDDATGATAQRTFPAPATYAVELCVSGPDGDASQVRRITVGDVAPEASFRLLPEAPRAGRPVTLVSTATDPDSAMTAFDWDLDGDGAFDDAQGVAVPWTFDRAGEVIVGLQVTDAFGLTSVALQRVVVAAARLVPLSPSPVVRLAGRFTSAGTVVTRLTVKAPAGAWVDVRCRGARRGCRFRRVARRSDGDRWRVRQAQGPLTAGAAVVVRVRRPGALGTYVRFTVRAGAAPKRVDRCLPPRPAKPGSCP